MSFVVRFMIFFLKKNPWQKKTARATRIIQPKQYSAEQQEVVDVWQTFEAALNSPNHVCFFCFLKKSKIKICCFSQNP